jgi:hypothetical protein
MLVTPENLSQLSWQQPTTYFLAFIPPSSLLALFRSQQVGVRAHWSIQHCVELFFLSSIQESCASFVLRRRVFGLQNGCGNTQMPEQDLLTHGM